MRCILLSLAIAVGLGLWFLPQMPDRMAVHFDGSGAADGWASRTEAAVLFAALLLFLAGVFGGIGRMMHSLPASQVNLPHREYWFAPERAEETRAYLAASMHHIGCATLLFMDYVLLETGQANLEANPSLGPGFLPALILYLAGIAWLVFRFWRRFRVPQRSGDTPMRGTRS